MISETLLYKQVGKRLKDVRENRTTMTQEQLANTVGLKRTSITNIESGLQRLPLHVLFRICDVMQVEAKELLPNLRQISEAPKMVEVKFGKETTQMDSKTAEVLDTVLSSFEPTNRKK